MIGGNGVLRFRSEFELRDKRDIPDRSGTEHVAASPYGNLLELLAVLPIGNLGGELRLCWICWLCLIV